MPVEFYVQQKPHFAHERLALRTFLEDLVSSANEKLVCVVISPMVQGQEKDLILISERAVVLVELKWLTGVEPYERNRAHLRGSEAQWEYSLPGANPSTVGGRSAAGSPWTQIKQGRHQVGQWLDKKHDRKGNGGDWTERLYAWVGIGPGFDGDEQDIDLPAHLVRFHKFDGRWFRVLPVEQLTLAFLTVQHPQVRLTPDEMREIAGSFAPLCTELEQVLPPIAVKPSLWTPAPIVPQLIGHATEETTLQAALEDPAAATLIIQGIAGVGRTAVAGWLAGRAQQQNYRVRWLSCTEHDSLTLAGFLLDASDDVIDPSRDLIRSAKVSLEDRMEAALSFYHQRRTLFVFDDYHALRFQDEFNRFIEWAARYRDTVKVLLTSREFVDGLRPPEAIRDVSLKPMNESDFGELVARVVRGRTLEAHDVHVLWERLDGNPRALELTAPLIRRYMLGANRLAELPLTATDAWFNGLTSALLPAARNLLQQLSVLRGRFDFHTVELLTGQHPDTATLTDNLIEQYMLQEIDRGWFTVAGLIRSVQLVQLGEGAKEAHRRVAKAFLQLAQEAGKYVPLRVANLLEAVYHLDQGKSRDECLKRAEEAFALLGDANDWERGQMLAEQVIGLLTSGGQDDERMVVWRTRAADLALERDQRGRAARHLAAAEGLLPGPGARLSNEMKLRWAAARIDLLLQQGRALYMEPRYEEAADRCETALALAQQHNRPAAEMHCLARLAQIERQQGKYGIARERNERVVAMAREMNNSELLCQGLSHLGLIARTEGDYGAALQYLREALEVARRAEDRVAEQMCMGHLGRAALLSGDLVTAESTFKECLQLARDLRSVRGVRFQLTNLCEALVRRGRREEAETLLAESEQLNEAAKDCIGQAFNLKHRGLLRKQAGEEAEGQQLIRLGIHILESACNQEYRIEFEQALNEGAQLHLKL